MPDTALSIVIRGEEEASEEVESDERFQGRDTPSSEGYEGDDDQREENWEEQGEQIGGGDDECLALHFQLPIKGVMISEEERTLLFKPFSSHGTASHLSRMGGLGLYLCKKLCKVFGGTVWAERGDNGSVLHFRDVNPEVPIAGQGNGRPDLWVSGKRVQWHVLLLFHDQTASLFLQAHLSSAGATVR